MGLFSKKDKVDTLPKSEAPTLVPSQNPSDSHLEKEQEVDTAVHEKRSTSSATSSDHENAKTTPLDEKTIEEAIADPEVNDGNDEAVYPQGIKLALIIIALCLSVFLVALDNTIIATAIPKITDRFNSLGDVGWYASAYLLTTCALQLFFGK
jgi:hypothetical protein